MMCIPECGVCPPPLDISGCLSGQAGAHASQVWAHLACLEAYTAHGGCFDPEHYVCRHCQAPALPGRAAPAPAALPRAAHSSGGSPGEAAPGRGCARKRAAGEREPSRLGLGQWQGRVARRGGGGGGRESSWEDPDEADGGPPPAKRRLRGARAQRGGGGGGGEADAAQQHPARLLERDAARRRVAVPGRSMLRC